MNKEKEFQHIIKAFQEEPTIKEHKNLKGWKDKSHQEYIEKGICTHTFFKENLIRLQFLGWELVLLKNGTYYINDTSGG